MPEQSSHEALQPAAIVAAQIRDVRVRRRWNQQQLADRLDEIGAPMDRSTVARIESGSRGISLEDTLHFAAALEVSPLRLMTPDKAGLPVAITPALVVQAGASRRWIRGEMPLPGQSERTFFQEVPEEEFIKQRHSGLTRIELLLLDIFGCVIEMQLDEHPETDVVVNLDRLLRALGQEATQWRDLLKRQYAEQMKRGRALGA